MKVVLSNAKNKFDIGKLVGCAEKYGIRDIECRMDYESLSGLEGLHGEKNLDELKLLLNEKGVRIYGFCLHTDFNLFRDNMMAKKSISLLNKLGGRNLRLILEPVPEDEVSEGMKDRIADFINTLSRFASYSAGGGGEGETTVRMSFDVLNQPGMGFGDILRINSSIQQSRNCGVALDFAHCFRNASYEDILEHVNGHEFTTNHLSIPADADIDEAGIFMAAASQRYDGPIFIDLLDDEGSDTGVILEKAQQYAFETGGIDYTKVSYPSSVARFFKSFGTAAVTPGRDIVAGEIGTWVYTYTVGKQGISKNGGIRFTFHHSTDWQEFQLDKPSMDGFVSVKTTGKAELSQKIIFSSDACWYICVKVEEGFLKEGDKVLFTIGDRAGGSNGSRAQTFQQKEFKFFVLVDANGNGIYFEHPHPPTVRIVGGKSEKLKVLAPSVVYTGESFSVGVRIEDKFHNTAAGYSAILSVRIAGETGIIAQDEIKDTDTAVLRFENIKIEKPGMYRLEVEDGNGLVGLSNYIKCTSDRHEDKVFWGDIHAHLGYMDSVGTVPEFYDYARNVSFLDFTCHSEHMDSFSGGRQSSFGLQWEIVKEGTRRYHEDGRFVTLLGYENSEIWDANIYFPGEDAPWHVDSYAQRLFDFARKHRALVIPHMTTYPQRVRGYDWNNYDAEVMPVAEIYSCHGSSEYFGGEMPLKKCEPGGYIVDALNRGHKLGFIGSGDGHDCMPGNAMLMENRCINGLVAVYAKELTREAVFEAIRNRRCYAATNARILAYFSIGETMSGGEMEAGYGTPLSIRFTFYGTGDIERTDIVKNGEIIYSRPGNGSSMEVTFEDIPHKVGRNYYYARMKQKDKEMAWVSPIFVNVKEGR